MSDSPTALGQLPSQAVHAHFATRPALFSVVFKALRTGISERYPNLQLDLLTLKLASPTPSGGYAFPLLAHVALAHVLKPRPLDLSPRGELPYYLSPAPRQWPGRRRHAGDCANYRRVARLAVSVFPAGPG
ncbi:hypothetical protein [Pseudomonas synxantha]|uniref:hypothetical protein n=1 Tax=Pseudomonas synxantha TaxID=47883 RepID=UPI0027D8B85D|nr:hypothetical protein [Pseudomonas synxantha]